MADTIKEFLDTLTFDAGDLPFVNKQVILGSLWWVEKVPSNQTPTKPYAVWDPKAGKLIEWNLADLNQMIQKVAKKYPNGASSTAILSQMIPDTAQSATLESIYVDAALGNIMLQYWAFGEVKY